MDLAASISVRTRGRKKLLQEGGIFEGERIEMSMVKNGVSLPSKNQNQVVCPSFLGRTQTGQTMSDGHMEAERSLLSCLT